MLMLQQQSDAQYMLGVCYYNGTGKTKNLPIAQSWFAKADAEHLPAALLQLD